MASLRIEIDREACKGSQVCTKLAPRTFVIDERGKALVADRARDPDDTVRRAALACPRFAIHLVEVEP